MKIMKHPGKSLLISVALLIALGLIFIYSASGPYSQQRNLSSWYYFIRQSIWALVALTALFVFSRINYRKFIKLSPMLMLISFVMLVMVLFTSAKLNVHRWLYVGFIGFQPSEIFKISLVMYLAYMLVDSKDRPKDIRRMVPHIIIAGVGLLLILIQPDMGTTMLIFITMATILFLAGLKLRYLMTSALIVLVLGGTMVFGLGYERDRIDDYLACLQDPLGSSADISSLSNGYYQSRQSLISIGSGGVLGRGLGGGGQKNLFLPAPHTDFIFSATAEEGGLLISLVILGLIFTAGFSAIKIAMASADLHGFLLASGLAVMITFQAIMNIGVALGLMPITGITLPFFSYGGSSLVISCAAVGLILSVAKYGSSPKPRTVRAR
jgi:cell division protein FtsW